MTTPPSSVATPLRTMNIVISGTNFWNPGDDFVRDGVIRVLRELFPAVALNFLFYNFNADFFPQSKFSGIGNYVSRGDLDQFRDSVDAVVIAGLSAGDEIKDLYRWVIENGLQDRVYLVGAGYENDYVAQHVSKEPEATIFKQARIIVGRTAKTPEFLRQIGVPYAHVNCPAILSVPDVKAIPAGKRIERIGFSIQLPHGQGLVNHSCAAQQSKLATDVLLELSKRFAVEVVAHHKSEYFHFLKALRGTSIPVLFSSFYQDLFDLYPRYDLVVTTRLHSSLFANGHGIPGLIINDTDRHTHTLDGFPHSAWVNTRKAFDEAFAKVQRQDLRAIAKEAATFKQQLLCRYVEVLSGPQGFGLRQSSGAFIPSLAGEKRQRTAALHDAGAPIAAIDQCKTASTLPADYQFDSELKEQKLVRALIQEGMTIFDVGAHTGKYTKLFSLLTGPKGRVFAFEPTPGSFRRLAEDVVELDLKNVTLLANAVADRSGPVTLHQFPEEYSSWNGLGRPRMEDPKRPGQFVPMTGSVEVEAVTLDVFCRERGIECLDYLKLDVEGAELRALRGARGLLERKAIRFLQFEISRKMLEGLNTAARPVFDYLAGHGYECHAITEEGRIGRKAADSSSFYENYIAVPLSVPASRDSDRQGAPGQGARVASRAGMAVPKHDRLNVGCGSDYREGFVNVDGNAQLPKVDCVVDIRPGVLPTVFPPACFRHVLAKDFLEHHTHWEARALLEDFHALLGDGGILELVLPDLEAIINDPHKSVIEKKTWLYGGQDITQPWEQDSPELNRKKYPQYFCHKYGWTRDQLHAELAAIGFDQVEFSSLSWNMRAQARKKPVATSTTPGKVPGAAAHPLPIHFFTIVLNGRPFIEHHIKAFERLPFEWHWHVVEGVAELNHDTAWSRQHGGRIAPEVHRHGLSLDGATEYLDALAKKFPNNITLYRKSGGAFWDGKLEMVNAPLANLREECLLWQVDADELWTSEQLTTARNLFLAHPEKTAAFYFCHYFVGEKLVITTRDTYGNNTGYEWIRTWRFTPGCRWIAHEPPRLCRPAGNGKWADLATVNPLRHAETEAAGLVFQHFAYVTPEQLQFKETYYGYAGALRQWKKLQQQRQFPVALSKHFEWVKDAALVNTAESQRIVPIATRDKSGAWTFGEPALDPGASIGPALPSPSPGPSPQGRGRTVGQSGNNPSASCGQTIPSVSTAAPVNSLSPGERAGVRGKGAHHSDPGTNMDLHSTDSANPLASDVKRILFVRTDAIGDAVLAAPMLPLIRQKYPDAKLAVLCREHVADLYLACPFVDSVICFDWQKVRDDQPARDEILREIGQFKPDLVLNTLYSRELVTELLVHAQRAPHVVGLEGNLSNISASERAECDPLYTRLLSSPGDTKPELERHRDFLAGLGIAAGKLEPQVWTSAEDDALAEAFFKEQQLDPATTIALFPGAQHDWKVYPHFGEALRELAGYRFLIFGGAEVAGPAEQLAAELPGPSINLCGKTALREMAALFRKCRLYVGADSAGAHIACAVGLPNVVVLGGGHFGRFFPYSPLTSVACLPLECYGCNWACKFPTVHCVKSLDPSVVAEAIRQTLAGPSIRPRVFAQDSPHGPSSAGSLRWKSPEQFLAGTGAETIPVSASGAGFQPASGAFSPRLPAAGRISAAAREHLEQAERCFNAGDLAEAAGHLERAVEHAPDSVELLTALGNLRFQLGDLPAARLSLRKAVSRRPDDALLHVLLANICLRLENAEEFECALGRALRLEPENAAALRLLADLNLQHGRFADAARGYAALLRQTPQDIGVLLGLARAFEGAGDLDTARAACEEALKFQPDHAGAKAQLERLRGADLRSAVPPACSRQALATTELSKESQAPQVENLRHGRPEVCATAMGRSEGSATQPLVSVIVSAYAAEKYMRACLEDLIAQTIFDQLEIIVIDSGSPQNERAIVDEFQRRHPNIHYHRTERETLYAAWNRAIGLARGKYIANANCDDSHRPDALEKLAAALEAHPDAGLAYGDYYTSTVPNDSFAHPSILRHVVHPSYHPATVMMYCVTGCHPMWRRTVFDKIGLFDPIYTAPGDYEFLFRFVQAGLRAVHVPQPLSLFFQNAEGLSWKSAAQSKNEHDRIVSRYRSEMPIERLYAVDPSNAASVSRAWTALGNLAMQHEVPWFSTFVQHLAYGRSCYEQALKADSSNVAAGQNLVVARLLQQGSAGDLSFLEHFPPDVAARLHAEIQRGQLQLACAEAPPAVSPIEFGERQAPREVPGEVVLPFESLARPHPDPLPQERGRDGRGLADSATLSASQPHRSSKRPSNAKVAGVSPSPGGEGRGEGGPKSLQPLNLPVRLAASFLHQGGATGDALNLAAPLAARIDLATFDHCEPYSRTFDERLPEELRSALRATRTRFNFCLGGVGIAFGGADDLKRVRGAVWHIARTSFAADRLPVEWVKTFNQMDELWVPSRFHAEAFASSGVERDKLTIVPSAVDAGEFDPARHEPLPLPHRAAFNFLAVFEWRARKGWDALLAAYLREFSAEDDVCLHLRTSFPRLAEAQSRGVIERQIREFTRTLNLGAKKLPRIELLAEEISLADMPRLYRAADCLVAPSRGEAWGRAAIEAMMMGLPVIATNWGALADILTADTAYPLDCELAPATNLELDEWQYHGQRWAEPSEKHLRDLMRQVQQNPAEARAKGVKAGLHTQRHFCTEAVTDLVVARLEAIEENLTKASCPPRSADLRSAVSPTSSRQTLTRSGANELGMPQQVGNLRYGRPEVCATVALEGSFLDFGSLSHVNRELTRQLAKQSGVSLSCVAKNVVPPELAHHRSLVETARRLKYPAPKNAQVTLRHAWPPSWDRPASGKWVLIQPWEFGVLPEEWVQRLEAVDEIWAPSEYVRRVYVGSGVDPRKVHVVPNGIDPGQFRPDAPAMKLATRKKFKFLFVGGTIHRKGPDLLLKAYLENFTAADDVCLVIKDFGGQSVYAGQTFEAHIRAAQGQPNAPEILYLYEDLAPESLPGLYTACDCLVHPYRGEGFGLPVLEAMACGLPVVVTGGGSTDDFATDDFAYRVPALKKQFGASVSGLKLVRDGWLLEPDRAVLGERMKWLADHRDEARVKGRAASEYVRREWTWERAAQTAAQRLRELAAGAVKESGAGSPGGRLEACPTVRSAKPMALPPVARVGHLGEARSLFSDGQLAAAWKATVAALEARPFHPEAFLLLAEIARAAGDVKRAKELAEHARKLAPKWKPAQQFLKNGAPKVVGQASSLPPGLPAPDSVSGKMPAQTGWKPAPPTVSVCLITKNEERFLGRCLESIRDLAQQIVVVDTGSTDWTRGIAARYGAEVYSFDWCDDFSAARNAALERATGDWVLFLDADEELLPDQREKLLKLLEDDSAIAFRLPMIDKGREEEGVSYVPRLFRNAPGLFHLGRVHEQVFSSIEVRRLEWGLENKFGDATLLHHGYTKEMVRSRDKIARNLRLLQKALEELPGEPHLLMNLGLELVRAGKLREGLEQYDAAFRALSGLPREEVAPELRETLLTQFSTHLLSAKRPADAASVLASPLAKSGGLTATLHWLFGLACIELKNFADGAEHMRRCLAKRDKPALSPINKNILKAGPHHCLALCLAALKQTAVADKAFLEAVEADPKSKSVSFDYARFLAGNGREIEALKQLHQLTMADPSDATLWLFGGQVALSQPAFLEFACDWTGEAVNIFPAHTGLAEQRAQALLLSGRIDEAFPLWRQLAAGPNPSHRAALLVCEARLNLPLSAVTPEMAARLNQEFVSWYRRLLAANAKKVVSVLNQRMDLLRPAVPAAVQILEAAMAEAGAVPVK